MPPWDRDRSLTGVFPSMVDARDSWQWSDAREPMQSLMKNLQYVTALRKLPSLPSLPSLYDVPFDKEEQAGVRDQSHGDG